MAFTYSSTLTSVKDQLRFLVQDTVDTGHFLEDTEIEFVATTEPNIYKAAAILCRSIAAKILKDVGYDDDELKYDPDKKAREYRELADQHEVKGKSSSGVSLSAEAMEANIAPLTTYDNREPAFTRDLHLEE